MIFKRWILINLFILIGINSLAAGEEPYVIFSRNDNCSKLVYLLSEPKAHEITSSLKFFTSQGAYAKTTFSIHAEKNLEQVKVELGELASEKGFKVIGKQNMELQVVKYLKKILYFLFLPQLLQPIK